MHMNFIKVVDIEVTKVVEIMEVNAIIKVMEVMEVKAIIKVIEVIGHRRQGCHVRSRGHGRHNCHGDVPQVQGAGRRLAACANDYVS